MSNSRIHKKKNKLTEEQAKSIEAMFGDDEFAKMWRKMHTPVTRPRKKVGRNEICPYCNSGKKFKNCECYKKYK